MGLIQENGRTCYWPKSPEFNPQKKAFLRKYTLQQIKEKAQQSQNDLLDQLTANLSDLVDDIVHQVEGIETKEEVVVGEEKKNRRENGKLPEKQFVARQSILTELLEIDHVKTIYHIFVAILIVFSINTILTDWIDKGIYMLNFELISWAFGKVPIVMTVWVCMILSTTVILYPGFQYWAHNRRGPVGYYDYLWLALYVIYQMIFTYLPVEVIIHHQLPPASASIISMEQVRLVMKAHAFVRSTAPQALNYKRKKDDNNQDENSPCPDFSKYLYFLFAPTLVYRNSYPRTQSIRWHYVFTNFVQVVACLFYIYYIFVRFCVPVFQTFNADSITPQALLVSISGCILPGILILFIGFFALLHSWLNAFAEMLKFGDRLFYKDWWNSSSFANYYRTWNVVVHDWLYTYVYKECYDVFGTKGRAFAMGIVFLLSAVVHEYILVLTFGFFYPVLFIMFAGAGFGFVFLGGKYYKRSGNVMMWLSLFIGTGVLLCLYSMEWYARINCPVTSDSWLLDNLIPRTWTCDFKL